MVEDEVDSDVEDPDADEVPDLDGQPIFNSEDPDETRSRDDSDKTEK